MSVHALRMIVNAPPNSVNAPRMVVNALLMIVNALLNCLHAVAMSVKAEPKSVKAVRRTVKAVPRNVNAEGSQRRVHRKTFVGPARWLLAERHAFQFPITCGVRPGRCHTKGDIFRKSQSQSENVEAGFQPPVPDPTRGWKPRHWQPGWLPPRPKESGRGSGQREKRLFRRGINLPRRAATE